MPRRSSSFGLADKVADTGSFGLADTSGFGLVDTRGSGLADTRGSGLAGTAAERGPGKSFVKIR